jgi:hypothetical protein
MLLVAACHRGQRCPPGTRVEGDRCVATQAIAADPVASPLVDATPPLPVVPIEPQPPADVDWLLKVPRAAKPPFAAPSSWSAPLPPKTPPGVLAYHFGESAFFLIRPSTEIVSRKSGEEAGAELHRAVLAKERAIRRGNGSYTDFFPLAPGEYVLLATYYNLSGDAPARAGKAWVRLFNVTTETIVYPLQQYEFGGTTHCPFASFDDGPVKVLLEYRSHPSTSGTDRVRFARVPVRNGRIVLRVFEVDDDVAHFDQLMVTSQQCSVTREDPVSWRALDNVDGQYVDIPNGKQLLVPYRVSGIVDGSIDVEVVANGYYDPRTH